MLYNGLCCTTSKYPMLASCSTQLALVVREYFCTEKAKIEEKGASDYCQSQLQFQLQLS